MGVRYLQTYLHEHRNSSKFCKDVNIEDLVKTFSAKTKTDEVIVVVDGIGFLYEQYDFRKYDAFMGGEILTFTKNIENFIKKFKNIGVHLVFFFDGTLISTKIKLWKSRQYGIVHRTSSIFKFLEAKMSGEGDCIEWSPEKEQNHNMVLPDVVAFAGRFLLKQMFGCEVYVSVGDCDKEMAAFAKANNCFAILTQDTDFLIYEGAEYLLSSRFLDLSKMTTVCYDRREFAAAHLLHVDQLPLLASLLGNDYVSVKNLNCFHTKLCSPDGHVSHMSQNMSQKFQRVSDFVRKQPTGEALTKKVPLIAHTVLHTGDLSADIYTSLESYDIEPNSEDLERFLRCKSSRILEIVSRKHKNCEIPAEIYPLLLGQSQFFKLCLEDHGSDLPSSALHYMPLRQNIYGVLFNDAMFSNRKAVREWHWDEKYTTVYIVPIVWRRDVIHPGLEELWSDSPTPEILTRRWKICASAISPDLSYKDLRELPMRYVVPTSVLHFLLHDERPTIFLKKHEVDAIISHFILLNYYSTREVISMSMHKYPTPRMAHIATIIAKGIYTIILLMTSCGFPLKDIAPWLYFDGKILCRQFVSAEKGTSVIELLENQEDLLDDFKVIQDIAYSGSPVDLHEKSRGERKSTFQQRRQLKIVF